MTNVKTAASPTVAPPSEMLTCPEVARILRVDPVTLRRWIGSGAVRAVKLGRQWRIERSEADHVRRYGVRRQATQKESA